ncbi:MAG: hypothetical protein KF814_07575 [Nitrospiraceae bacterium]|nr:hypothetical protein [Nitrospiraceae bacterium]
MKTSSALPGPDNRTAARRAMLVLSAIWLCLSAWPAILGADESTPSPGPHEQRIEVLMRNYDFVLAQPAQLRFGIPTVIILRNQDIVPHGFSSTAMAQLAIQAHGEGVAVQGKGIEGFRVDPGKTLAIHLVTDRSNRILFNCDLHPQMKGELFVLEIPAA